jgi:hypothetical protein
MADRLWDEERKLLLSVYGLWELEAIETATLFFFSSGAPRPFFGIGLDYKVHVVILRPSIFLSNRM